MPTENRSSNTEMISDKLPPCADEVFKNGVSACLVGDVPKHAAETICQSLSAVTGWKIDWHYFGGRTHIKALAPAPQPRPDPIAWMVGTAIWWTKEEAERDAAETVKTITPIGPMSGIAPAEEHQGEPVARVEVGADRNACAMIIDQEWLRQLKDKAEHLVVHLYTHADPGEVERLREGISKHWKVVCDQRAELDSLRAQLATETARADSAVGDANEAERKLAERDALLRAVPVMPTSVDRRPNDEDQPDGYLEGDRSWCDNNKDAVEWLIENHAAIRAALSASAEPSAPKCGKCAGSALVQYPEHAGAWSDCPECKPSAPVERDERAEFEACFDRTLKEQEAGLEHYQVSTMRFGKEVMWEGWKARAALERKPS
ncbi:hypothetical protein ACNFCI_10030 [Pseudomonas sp. NY15356]|uniref:hypothetical protein n=1 Tax=Pseudomonas sp. NY15356 TaxID=3400352 RepID=UPI003A85C1F7